MGWEGAPDIYDPIGLNISCFCAHLHLLVSTSARLSLDEPSPRLASPARTPHPFNPYLLLSPGVCFLPSFSPFFPPGPSFALLLACCPFVLAWSPSKRVQLRDASISIPTPRAVPEINEREIMARGGSGGLPAKGDARVSSSRVTERASGEDGCAGGFEWRE